MNVLVTGADGFIGKNLIWHLNENDHTVIKFTRENTLEDLKEACEKADFIFHLAGINRPEDTSEFAGNTTLTQSLIDSLLQKGLSTPIFFSSSIQASHDNPYGNSKREAEEALLAYAKATGNRVHICRLPNVFGKWCRPHYNSFVATFCHNIANDIPINIHDPSAQVSLVYVDDICKFLLEMLGADSSELFVDVDVVYDTTVGEVAALLNEFKESRASLVTSSVGEGFPRALYSTFISYFSPEQFHYDIPSYADERGVFAEVLKTKESGQFSFFTAHPGITRGGHYHHSKNEKFLVIKGQATFCFKNIDSGETYQLDVSSDKYQIVETVPGWSHDITNTGDEEMLVMLWANEIFDRDNPDTFAMETK